MTFKLDNLKFAANFIQGPLAGYSHASFRQLLWPAKHLAYACTEMLPASCVINEQHNKHNRFTWRHPAEQTLCYQLSGKNASELALAAAIVADIGADIIDLNVGCPKKKIRRRGCGSAMLDDIANLMQCVEAIRQTVSCPVTVKTRIPDPNNLQQTTLLIRQLADAGASAVILHGRHWQADNKPIMLEHYHAAVQANACPIIINGDVQSIEQGQKIMDTTGAAACMIARAGFITPWLYQFIEPLSPIYYIEQHLSGMLQFMPESTVLMQARSILAYYSKNYCQDKANEIKSISLSAKSLTGLTNNLSELLC